MNKDSANMKDKDSAHMKDKNPEVKPGSEGKWELVKGSAKKAWAGLTDSDFQKAGESVDKLYTIIHDKYGDSKDSIKAKIEKMRA